MTHCWCLVMLELLDSAEDERKALEAKHRQLRRALEAERYQRLGQ